MKLLYPFLMIFFLAAGLPPLPAQELPPADLTVEPPDPSLAFRSSSEAIGYPIRNAEGRPVGQVVDLVVDLQAGYLPYLLFIPASGDEERIVPLPLHATLFLPEDDEFLLDVESPEVLENAPTLDSASPEGAPDGYIWDRSVDMYWSNVGAVPLARYGRQYGGGEPYYRYSGGPRLLPGIQLPLSVVRTMGVQVEGSESPGSIDGVVVNLLTGQIPYALFRLDGETPVPLSAFTLDLEENTLFSDHALDVIEGAPRPEQPGRSDELQDYWSGRRVETALRPGMRVIPGLTIRGGELLDYEVVNPDGETLGGIADFVVTPDGSVTYLMMERSGFLGLDAVWYPIPLRALTLGPIMRTALLDLPEDRLEEAPGFERGALPDTRGPEWDRRVRDFWSRLLPAVQPGAVEPADVSRAVLGSRLMDFGVINPVGEDLGRIEDLVLDLQEAEVRCLALSFGGFLGIGGKLFAIPLEVADLDAEQQNLVLHVDRETLEQAPGFDEDDWPDTYNPRWDRGTRDFWRTR